MKDERKAMLRALSLLTLLLLTTSCVNFPQPAQLSPLSPTSTKDAQKPLWLIAGELHTDFVAETDWLIKNGCYLPSSLHGYRYLCFGWGDREAYTNRWGSEDIPRALFWPSESIVQVVAFNSEVEPSFPKQNTVKVNVSEKNGTRLAHFLNHSFSYHSANSTTPITLQPARWGHGYFIKSPYSYYLPRMCNQWVAAALKEAGVNTTKPGYFMTAGTLTSQITEYNTAQKK